MKKYKLRNCCRFIDYRGKTPEKADNGYRIITAKNVKALGYCDEPKEYIPVESYGSVMVRGIPRIGDILFTTEAPLGNVGRIPEFAEPFAVGQRLIVIQPEEELLDYQYMVYKLRSSSFQKEMFRRSSGSTVRGIRSKELIEIEIEFPELSEQKKISNILLRLEQIIELRKNELQKSDNLIKSRFVEMFGDLKSNTKGWDMKTFDELTYLITDGEHVTPRRTDKGIYLLSARNVLNHSIHLEYIDYIDQEEYDRIAKRIIPKEGDVLISCSGTVGRCCSVPFGLQFQMVRSIALLRFKEDINPVFAEYMITSDYLQEQINTFKTASSQANLFQGKIKALKGFVPPIELQIEFLEFVHQVDKLKSDIQKSLSETQTLMDSLMQQYFG